MIFSFFITLQSATLKSGKYIYRLETDGFNDAKVLIKEKV
jgi:hypothetical protein